MNTPTSRMKEAWDRSSRTADGFYSSTTPMSEFAFSCYDEGCNLERELTAVTKERDELKALLTKEQGAVTISRNGYVQELERQLDEAQESLEFQKKLNVELNKREGQTYHELAAVTEQRDRLAKALRECREDSIELLGERDWWQHEPRGDYQQRYRETRHNAKRAEAALQSLTLNQP